MHWGCSILENQIETIDCTRIKNGLRIEEKEVVAIETKLKLYVDGEFETQFLHSAGLDQCLVSGYLLSSGRIRSKAEITRLLTDGRECWVDLRKSIPEEKRVDRQKTVAFDRLIEIRDLLLENQSNHRATRGFHGAILYELTSNRWFACEDIGRHNAVDKVIGYGIEENYELSNSVLLLSGRLLSNIVSKGIHSGIPVIASMTVATSEGIWAARNSKCTLVGSLSEEGCWLYHEGVVKVQTAIQ